MSEQFTSKDLIDCLDNMLKADSYSCYFEQILSIIDLIVTDSPEGNPKYISNSHFVQKIELESSIRYFVGRNNTFNGSKTVEPLISLYLDKNKDSHLVRSNLVFLPCFPNYPDTSISLDFNDIERTISKKGASNYDPKKSSYLVYDFDEEENISQHTELLQFSNIGLYCSGCLSYL